ARYQPTTLVLRELDRTERGIRASYLTKEMTYLAYDHGMSVYAYTFDRVRDCFAAHGIKWRDEIANAIAKKLTDFSHRLPRKATASSGRCVSLFDAAALALTHYACSDRP